MFCEYSVSTSPNLHRACAPGAFVRSEYGPSDVLPYMASYVSRVDTTGLVPKPPYKGVPVIDRNRLYGPNTSSAIICGWHTAGPPSLIQSKGPKNTLRQRSGLCACPCTSALLTRLPRPVSLRYGALVQARRNASMTVSIGAACSGHTAKTRRSSRAWRSLPNAKTASLYQKHPKPMVTAGA